MSRPSIARTRLAPGRIVGAVVVWAVSALLAVLGALDLVHCLLAAACATALLVVWPRTAPDPPRLPDPVRHAHPGGRRDLAELSWSATDVDGRVSTRALGRVRALAAATGLDAVRDDIDHNPSPSVNHALRWLDSIDEKERHD